ncbi:MAG: DUF4097 family beta strand repeat-containing protein [Porcipelethomonas sp.]
MMKKSKKTAMITAASLIAAGAVISFGALFAMDFDIKKINTVTLGTNTYTVDQAFDNISVEGAECNVRLRPSDENFCKVVCYESDRIYHSVEVMDNTLKIEREDISKWYDNIMNICWNDMEVTVYLPKNEYKTLRIENISGNVEIPGGFTFDDAVIKSSSGDVKFSADVNNALSVEANSGDLTVSNTSPGKLSTKTSSGDIKIECVNSGTELTAETTSGEMKITDFNGKNISAESSSGDITFSGCLASGNIKTESISGEVRMYNCDADSLWIKTSSGDVSGTTLTEKIFITDTSSGDVNVPQSVTGGKCEIITDSGDIEFEIEK